MLRLGGGAPGLEAVAPADADRLVEVARELARIVGVTATIVAERAETLELLQRDSRDIERLLQNAGLNADAGSLSFGLRGDESDEPETAATSESDGSEDDADGDAAIAQAATGDGSGQHALNILV